MTVGRKCDYMLWFSNHKSQKNLLNHKSKMSDFVKKIFFGSHYIFAFAWFPPGPPSFSVGLSSPQGCSLFPRGTPFADSGAGMGPRFPEDSLFSVVIVTKPFPF